MSQPEQYNDEIDLREILKVIWNEKKQIFKVTLFFTSVSLVFSLLLTNYYKSESLLYARSSSQNQSMISQYSGLASLAGISLPSSGEDKVQEVIEIIKSRRFVKHLITFEGVLPSIISPKSFDKQTGNLNFDEDEYDIEKGQWIIEQPTYIEAHEIYKNNLVNISQNKATGFITIEVEHISPVFAKEFLDLIIREANELQRTRDMENSSDAIKYLKTEFSKTSLVEMKDSISSMLESQLETQMLTQINEDYILVEIDPPFVSEKKSRPSRALIIIIGTILGGILSSLSVLVRYYYLGDNEI